MNSRAREFRCKVPCFELPLYIFNEKYSEDSENKLEKSYKAVEEVKKKCGKCIRDDFDEVNESFAEARKEFETFCKNWEILDIDNNALL